MGSEGVEGDNGVGTIRGEAVMERVISACNKSMCSDRVRQ